MGTNGPRKWPGIANPVPIGQSGANRSIQCQSANLVPIRCQSGILPPLQILLQTASTVSFCQCCANLPTYCQCSILLHVCQSTEELCPIHCNWKWIGTALASSLANPGYSEDKCASNLYAFANPRPTHCQCTVNAVWYDVFCWIF